MNLKPCPFCGGQAHFRNKANDDIAVPGVAPSDMCGDVECGTAGCLLEHGADWYDMPSEAIDKWNRRA